MVSNYKNILGRFLLAGIIVLVCSLGCLCLPASFLAKATITPLPEATEIIPSPTPFPVSTTIPIPATQVPVGNTLNAQGPWLLIETTEVLWAVNPDGSGLSQIIAADYWNGNLQGAVQPNGNLVAFIAPMDMVTGNTKLYLLSLPGTEVHQVAQLTNGEDLDVQAERAIGLEKSFAWSPDGNRLAFTSAMEDASADLYIYDTRTDSINRLSQDKGQDYSPSWSPDGKYLVYLEANAFGTDAGTDLAGVWSVSTEGGTPEMISSGGTGAEILGWMDEKTVILVGSNYDCGPSNLRLYDLAARQEKIVYPGCIYYAAASMWNPAAMFSNDRGTFLFTLENPVPIQVSQDTNAYIDPMGPDDRIFTVRSQNGLIATYGISEYDHLPSPVTSPTFSDTISLVEQDVVEYGAIWGWTSKDLSQPGVWITGPGLEIGQIYKRAADFPTWDAHNNLLFFAISDYGGFDLYRTTFDAYYTDLSLLTHIDEYINSIAWLGNKYGD